MSTAFEYLTEVLEITKNQDEDIQAFLQRAAVELQNLSEDDWDNLPDALQEWYNKAADIMASAVDGDLESVVINPIPGMEGTTKVKSKTEAKKPAKAKKKEVVEEEDVEEVEEEEVEEEEVEEEVKKPKRGRKPKEAKEPKVKKEKTPKVKKEKEPKGPTAANAVRQILCENMDLSLDDIMVKLEEMGVAMKRSSMQVVALNTKQAFVIAEQVGEVKNSKGEVVLQKI